MEFSICTFHELSGYMHAQLVLLRDLIVFLLRLRMCQSMAASRCGIRCFEKKMTFGTKPRRYVLAISLRAVRFDLVVRLRHTVSRHPRGFVLDAVVLPFCWDMLACVSPVAAL